MNVNYSLFEALRRYLFSIALLNLFWEFLHMPLYQLWEDGTAAEIVFAAIHCTGGDILIALCSITGAIILTGSRKWPNEGFRKVILLTIVFGFLYTAFSEWLNIEIREAWAYSVFSSTSVDKQVTSLTCAVLVFHKAFSPYVLRVALDSCNNSPIARVF